MVKDDNAPAVPELARRITVCSSAHDPAAALAGVLTSMPASGIALGDIIADSGYSHRKAGTWALPLRQAGASLVQDLHPNDRGPRGTHDGPVMQTETCTVPPHRKRCCSSSPCHPAPHPPTPPPTTSRPPNSPGTNSAFTPARTPTATAVTPAQPSPGKSAARSAPRR
jgi:hypothetical protein